MKISIVTISFNQVTFLKRAIESVLRERASGIDIEYIIVDPGSTDGSRELIESYGDRVIKVFKTDTGPADGLNNGFSVATGDIYGYINADDAYLPGAVSEAINIMTKHSDLDVIYGNSYIVDSSGKGIKRFSSNQFNLKRFAFGSVVICQQSTFFRSECFTKVRGFNSENVTSWDAELVVDMAIAGAKVKWVNKYWAIFAIYDGTITGSQRMADLSVINRSRIFKKIMGRDSKGLDMIGRASSKLIKWVINPVSLAVPILVKLNLEKHFVSKINYKL
jgi:glycosyltransferase involved in cell wall biosynthesis